MAVSETALQVPLCVNLDGNLIRSNLELESALLLIKRNPLYLLRMLFWLLRGKAALQAEIAARVTVNAAALAYNSELLEWLRLEHRSGRTLWLCTATHEAQAQRIVEHLGIFAGVIVNSGQSNPAGATAAQRLVERFGAGSFDYCGNEPGDLAVWREANGAIVVGGGAHLESAVAGVTSMLRTFPSKSGRARAVVRALRPHQWTKNALIAVPLMAAHGSRDGHSLISVALAVLAFCSCASSVYVLNDLLDLEADRAHPRKRKRPFAAGDLSIAAGLALFPVLLAVGGFLALFLPDKFQLVFVGYYALTCAYSFGLKGRAIVDAIALAGLYTIRVIAGATAANVPLSFWLLLFSGFLFLSLAFVKRYAELDALRRRQGLRAAGRGYHIEDLAVLQSLGTAAGYLSVLVLALYINSPEVTALYARPKMIWLLCVLVLYWVSRVWMKAQRGEMHDDPVVFALKDRPSLLLGVLALLTTMAAI